MFELPQLEPTSLLRLGEQPVRRSRVRIGISGNLGGHTRELCAGVAVAAEAWSTTANPAYALELVWAEDAFDVTQTRRAAAQLVQVGCVAVIGHLASAAALAAADIYSRAQIPFFAPGASHPGLTTHGFSNLLRLYGRDDDLADMFTEVVTSSRRRRAILVWQDSIYGQTLAAFIQRSLLEHGVDLVAKLPWRARFSACETAALTHADVVLFAGTYQIGAHLLRQLRALGYTGALVMGDDAYIAELPALAAEGAEGLYVISTGVDRTHPAYTSFHTHYVARAGLEPGAYAVTSYVAMHLLLQTLEGLRSNGPEACLTQVRALAATDPSLLGPLYFTPTGDLLAFPWAVYEVQHGHFSPQSLPTEVHEHAD